MLDVVRGLITSESRETRAGQAADQTRMQEGDAACRVPSAKCTSGIEAVWRVAGYAVSVVIRRGKRMAVGTCLV